MAKTNTLWVEKYRPDVLSHYIGKEHLKKQIDKKNRDNRGFFYKSYFYLSTTFGNNNLSIVVLTQNNL